MKRGVWLLIIVLLSSCQAGRMVWYNFADIRDHRIFPSRQLKAAEAPFAFQKAAGSTSVPDSISFKGSGQAIDHFLEESNTVAFLVIRNDTVLYEKYFNGYEQASVVPSFSMAKSITSALIGCAIADGHIKSVQEPVTNYIPELRKEFGKVTIEHLLQMTSGIKFNEAYINPFSEVAKFYYGTDLRKYVKRLKLEDEPGTKFEYCSGNTQLLGLVLERALKNKTITKYFEEKIWGPLGMEYDASWSIDSEKSGLEKTFCCVNARARDYARIGRLYLNNGNWNGKQLVPEDWVRQSTKIDTSNGSSWSYQYQWWLASDRGDYYADGFLGQFIYINPSKKLVIVRLGKNHGGVYWRGVFRRMAEKL